MRSDDPDGARPSSGRPIPFRRPNGQAEHDDERQPQSAASYSRTKGEQQARAVWRATVALFVGVAIAAGVLLATDSSPASPPARWVAAADLNAPSSLVKAANKVGFVPTTEPGVGLIESQPPSEASPPSSNRDLSSGWHHGAGVHVRTLQGQRVSLQSLRG